MGNSTGILTINLESISANWRHLASLSGSGCGAVVKANAYGLGVIEVSKALFNAGCRLFYVVTLEEAKQLRACLPTASIILLGGLFQADPMDCLKYQLIPVLFSRQLVEQWVAFSTTHPEALQPIIKIDTGMHRYGIDVDEFIAWVSRSPEVLLQAKPIAIMSHLACADDKAHPLNQLQLERFMRAKQVVSAVDPSVLFSLANSSGIFLGPDYYFDWSRPGAALYGVNPLSDAPNPMSQVVSISLPIAQIKTVRPGESIGYGATFKADKPMAVAIVFGGYADGLLRQLSNSGAVNYAGHSLPIIGRVSMDSIMVDVSRVGGNIVTGDRVELMSDSSSLDRLASQAGTIGYELLTCLGQRYERRYV